MQKTHERLEVRHLRLARAIAAEGSVTRAAGFLNLSQSAVSHQLLDLERDLGTRLFDRVGKKMIPTVAGARLIAGAERLLGELEELERSLECGGAKLVMRVTTSCFTSYGWLPTALTRFNDSHPDVEIDIVIEATRRAVPALIADEVDLAIVTQPPADETWQRVAVVDSELVTIASRTHPIVARVKRGHLRWDALRGHEILVHDISDADLARLTRAVGQPMTVRKIPLSEAMLDLARSGRSIALVDRWTVEQQLGKDLVALAMTPRAPRTFYACWRRANPRGLPIRALIEEITAASARVVTQR